MTDLHKTPGLFGKLWLPRDVAGLLYDNGWTDALVNVEMNGTVYAESGRYEAAVGTVNPNGSQDWGMFQLNNRHYATFGYKTQEAFYEDAIVAVKAAPLARQLFVADRKAGGTGFGPWFGYGSANYTKGLAASCGGLANFLSIKLIGKSVCG
jgi:hypothetical protein